MYTNLEKTTAGILGLAPGIIRRAFEEHFTEGVHFKSGPPMTLLEAGRDKLVELFLPEKRKGGGEDAISVRVTGHLPSPSWALVALPDRTSGKVKFLPARRPAVGTMIKARRLPDGSLQEVRP